MVADGRVNYLYRLTFASSANIVPRDCTPPAAAAPACVSLTRKLLQEQTIRPLQEHWHSIPASGLLA
jgi:hypothetical protein